MSIVGLGLITALKYTRGMGQTDRQTDGSQHCSEYLSQMGDKKTWIEDVALTVWVCEW